MAKVRKQFHAIGLMSGTSLDGLDIAWCRFEQKGTKWSFEILKAVTLSYSPGWKEKLSQAHTLRASDLMTLHAEYGHWLGKNCHQFIRKNKIKKLDCIASHGHTVFHQPQKKFTFQLGDGNAIHAEAGVPVVYDFRSLDVQLGGQGAPLVPIGDKLLFPEFDVCVNLGGIANLSMDKMGKRVAFDICFANMGLNYLTQKIDLPFDTAGSIASTGKVNEDLLQKIIEFHKPFKANRPSLAREHFANELSELLNNESIPLADRLSTFCEGIAIKIKEAIQSKKQQTILLTGGGALNSFLVSRIQAHLGASARLKFPSSEIINFKEAVVFAFLGILRLQNKINVLKSVTGASRDSSCGVLIGYTI